MNCYGTDSYDIKMKKRAILKKGNYLLNSVCCGKEECNVLIEDIEKTANKCHELFRDMHLDTVDSEGKILNDSLCSDLEEKKSKLKRENFKLSGVINSNLTGGIFKKSKCRKRRFRKVHTLKRRITKKRRKKRKK